jgi:hypothetical protein
VAIACGDRALLPAVRQANEDTLIIANGFSCQQQIAQTTERRPLHLAQILQMALHLQNGEPIEDGASQLVGVGGTKDEK